jgi:hypothetical protein
VDILRLYAPDAPYKEGQIKVNCTSGCCYPALTYRSPPGHLPIHPSTAHPEPQAIPIRIRREQGQRQGRLYHVTHHRHSVLHTVLLCFGKSGDDQECLSDSRSGGRGRARARLCPGNAEHCEVSPRSGYSLKAANSISHRPDISKTMLRFLQEIIAALVEESATMPAGVLDCLLGQITGNKDVSLSILFQSACLESDACHRQRSSTPIRRHSSLQRVFSQKRPRLSTVHCKRLVAMQFRTTNDAYDYLPAHRQYLQRSRSTSGRR